MAERKDSPLDEIAARSIVVSRVFDAPRERVWSAWTDPAQVVKWWGPRGFTTVIEEMDVKPGGVWKHVMHGPDGAKYPNHSVFLEVVKPERIVYSHGGKKEGGPGVSFESTWTFKEVEKGKTELTIRMIFKSAEERDFVAKEFGAVEGGRQTLERLSEHFDPPFVITRVFDAPRDLLFTLWTDPEHLKNWFSPKGSEVSFVKADIRPGGISRFCMSGPNGMKIWGKASYREVVRPTRVVYSQSFTNEAGEVVRHPMSPTWPLEMLTTIVFDEEGAGKKTRLTLKWLPIGASAEERATFEQGHAGMGQGWGGTFEQLSDYLHKVAAR